jgi:hypothetical protein
MARYQLIEISHGAVTVVLDHRSQAVRVVCEGSAAQVALAALEELPSADIHRLRLEDIPRVQRRVGSGERNTGLEATMPEAAALASAN